MNKISLTAIILTYNEEIHLERCLLSIKDICSDIVIVDSLSKDNTKLIANQYNARFFENPFQNHAAQLNWAIENSNIKTEWVIRLDADEYVSEELALSIMTNLTSMNKNVHGIRVKRLMYFFDKPLKKGGMYPIWHLRIWKSGKAICEQRWMDERMVLKEEGNVEKIEGDIIDYNLNNVTWWTAKHNNYATKEAIDILDKIFGFTNNTMEKSDFFGTSEQRRRWLKMRYLRMPLFIRPFIFFIIRYFFQLGFLEGKRGFIWSVLQCFWYRFLVDAKIYEAYKNAGRNKQSLIQYFKDEYGYDVTILG